MGTKERIAFYVKPEVARRIRAAVVHSAHLPGHRSLTDFVTGAVMDRVVQVEEQLNGGVPFPPAGKGEIPRGRRTET